MGFAYITVGISCGLAISDKDVQGRALTGSDISRQSSCMACAVQRNSRLQNIYYLQSRVSVCFRKQLKNHGILSKYPLALKKKWEIVEDLKNDIEQLRIKETVEDLKNDIEQLRIKDEVLRMREEEKRDQCLYEVKDNSYFVHVDYKVVKRVQVADYKACCNECKYTHNCFAWTYATKWRSHIRHCWLYDSSCGRRIDDTPSRIYISGRKRV